MGVRTRLAAFFATEGRQAVGWTSVGMIGVLLAGLGIWLALRDGEGKGPILSTDGQTVTVSPTRTTPSSTAIPSPTPSATPTGTATPAPAATPRPQPAASVDATEPAPEPTSEPTPGPVVAGGPYCPSVSQTSTPTRVLGIVTIGGVAAPAGMVVTLAFDGVAGPSEEVTVSGGAAGFSIDFNAAQGECANRVGAAIGAYVNGTFVASGQTVGGAAGQAGFIRFDIALP